MRVTIKSWRDMEREYGTDIQGDICPEMCDECFTQEMAELCEEEVEIVKDEFNRVLAFDCEGNSWIIRPFMVEEKDLNKFLDFIND